MKEIGNQDKVQEILANQHEILENQNLMMKDLSWLIDVVKTFEDDNGIAFGYVDENNEDQE